MDLKQNSGEKIKEKTKTIIFILIVIIIVAVFGIFWKLTFGLILELLSKLF